ncbi:MAG: hypothetical protein SGJ05_10020 [bacterium]|nr:hypothetical protein [bacterium]
MQSVRAIVILSMLVCCVVESTAQIERVLPRRGASSLEGTSFVLGFMENEILETGDDSELSLFISSEYPANVVIDFPNGTRFTEVLVAHSVRIVPISRYYETHPSERPENKAIFVTSDLPVIVYAMSTKEKTTDTYTAIPIPFLGTEYYSVNRPNDNYVPSGFGGGTNAISRGGEFMVLATESGTDVTITPRCSTEGGARPGVPFTVTLNKGQVYLVRAEQGVLGSNDLTGSRIQSTKPVGLLSGHVRSSIPTRQECSKDHLIEMLPPVDKWGTQYATTPLALVQGGDYIRMVAAYPNTDIEIDDGSGITTIRLAQPGDSREFRVTGPAFWKSTQVFLLVQFMPSSKRNPYATTAEQDYDPAMVVVPALSQYVMGALFQFPVLQTQTDTTFQVRHYYINLVADSVALATLKINGIPIATLAPSISTRKVPGTSLRWAQVRLNEGVYSIACDTGTFSGVMYGTSWVDSYANLFGLRWGPLPTIDVSPPEYALAVDCGTVTGTITDVSESVPGIYEIFAQTPPTTNYAYSLSAPIDTVGTRRVDARVRDMWKDATLVLHTYDTQGNGKEWLYRYDAPNIRIPQSVTLLTMGSAQICLDAWIVNIDTTPVVIRDVTLQGDPRYSLGSVPTRDTLLAAGDSVRVSVCFMPSIDTIRRSATVHVLLPCDLKKSFVVKSLTNLSIRTESIDFGPVRIGDTACGRVPVINDGQNPFMLTSLIMSQLFQQFTPDTASLGLPRRLESGDTMWVNVCFMPDSVVAYRRIDTVGTFPSLNATVGYTGRGIRPDVEDIVIDWGRRRVGTRNDSTFTLRNTGEAACLLSRVSRSGDTASFDYGTFGMAGIALQGDTSSIASVAFLADSVAPFALSIPFVVDWRFHDTVRIRFFGEGIIPAVETFDIDMGTMVVGTRRDSVANLARSFGSERLTVTSVWVEGADQGSFILPASLTTITGMATPLTLADVVSFIPQRAGYQSVRVAFEHDAMPGSAKDTSYVLVYGVGILPDTTAFGTSLIAATMYEACVDTSAIIRMENTGNTDIVIYNVELYHNTSQIFSDTNAPYVLAGHTSHDVTVLFTPDRSWAGTLQSVVRYGSNQVEKRNVLFDVYVPKLVITSTPFISVSPGASIDIETHVRCLATQDVDVSLLGTYSVPSDRLQLQTDNVITATVDDAIGVGRKVPIGLVKESTDVYRWTLETQVLSPFHVTWTVPAKSLWKDNREFDVQTAVDATPCSLDDSAKTTITNELCAGAMRVIHFGAAPRVSLVIAPNPVEQDLEIEVTASRASEISLHLQSVSGEQFVLAEKILLITGTQHVKFSRSNWSSGLYWLYMRNGNSQVGLPVLFVN